jgi:hypothetical protein
VNRPALQVDGKGHIGKEAGPARAVLHRRIEGNVRRRAWPGGAGHRRRAEPRSPGGRRPGVRRRHMKAPPGQARRRWLTGHSKHGSNQRKNVSIRQRDRSFKRLIKSTGVIAPSQQQCSYQPPM